MTTKVFCQNCGLATLPAAKFCARCGQRSFGPQPPAQPAAVVPAPPAAAGAKSAPGKFCAQCATPAMAAALFCAQCGHRAFSAQPPSVPPTAPAPLQAAPASPVTQASKSPGWKRFLAASGAVVAVLAVATAAYLYYVQVQEERARVEAAKEKEAQEAGRQQARQAWGRGNRALELQDADKAIGEYSEAIRLWPEFAGAYVSRGNAHLFRTAEEQAIADYGTAITIDPNYPDAYLARGMLRWLKGELGMAEADLGKLVSLRPGEPFYVMRLARVHYDLKQPKEVEGIYRRIYDEDRSRDWALEGWLAAFAVSNGEEKMLAEIAKVEAAGQAGDRLLYLKGQALMTLKRYAEAIPVMRRVLEGDPAKVPTDASLSLASAYKATGDSARCKETLRDYAMRMGRPNDVDLRTCE